MLIFKYQVGAVIGKKGQTIADIRRESRAMVKVLQAPDTPNCAAPDDEMITISGTFEHIRSAVIQLVKVIRTATADAATKKPRHSDSAPFSDIRLPPDARANPPRLGGISALLPPQAAAVFDNNASISTDDLVGNSTVEYRVLLPNHRVGAILGSKGSVRTSCDMTSDHTYADLLWPPYI